MLGIPVYKLTGISPNLPKEEALGLGGVKDLRPGEFWAAAGTMNIRFKAKASNNGNAKYIVRIK